jgi:hypothetical protein
VGQAAAAGDLSPRQLHYRAAELRRYQLKYPEKIAEYMANPMIFPGCENLSPEDKKRACENSCIEYMRAEDIANRIVAAFEEVPEWASQEKFSAPELKHEVRVVDLQRRMFPREMMEEEKKNHENFMNEEMTTMFSVAYGQALNVEGNVAESVEDLAAMYLSTGATNVDIIIVNGWPVVTYMMAEEDMLGYSVFFGDGTQCVTSFYPASDANVATLAGLMITTFQ